MLKKMAAQCSQTEESCYAELWLGQCYRTTQQYAMYDIISILSIGTITKESVLC